MFPDLSTSSFMQQPRKKTQKLENLSSILRQPCSENLPRYCVGRLQNLICGLFIPHQVQRLSDFWEILKHFSVFFCGGVDLISFCSSPSLLSSFPGERTEHIFTEGQLYFSAVSTDRVSMVELFFFLLLNVCLS